MNLGLQISHRRGALQVEAPLVCGILNVTPDSFSDGGKHASPLFAVKHALNLVEEGASIIDVGGESTRPGAEEVSPKEELARIMPVIEELRAQSDVVISVDTTKTSVADGALKAGADIVNDVSGGLFDKEIIDVAKTHGAGYICGHVDGRSMPEVHKNESRCPGYKVILERFCERIAYLAEVFGDRLVADPCIGFGKSTKTNLELIRSGNDIMSRTGVPVMIGVSRKRILGELTGRSLGDRDPATVGASLSAVSCGASLLRVHNVKIMKDALAAFWPSVKMERNV